MLNDDLKKSLNGLKITDIILGHQNNCDVGFIKIIGSLAQVWFTPKFFCWQVQYRFQPTMIKLHNLDTDDVTQI